MATILDSEPGKPRKRRPLTGTRPRYARNQKVKGGTLQRSRRRLKQTGPVSGVDASDGVTGREARKIKRAARRTPADGQRPGQRRSTSRKLSPEQQERRSIRREVNAETQLQFGPQERELGFQRQQSDQFQANQTGWYGQHVRDMQLAQTSQQAFQQGLLQGQNTAVTNAATTDQGANSAMLAQQQADAANRGTAVDPALAQTLQQGVAARQASGVAGTTALAGRAQAQGAYMANQVVQGSEQGLQARQDEQARRRALDRAASEMAADKGAFKVKTKAQLQERYWKQRLEEAVFGLDVEQEANDQRNERRDDRRTARDQRIDNRRMSQSERRQQREARSRVLDRRHDNSLADSKEQRIRDQDLADDGKLNGSSGPGAAKPKYTQPQKNANQKAFRDGRQAASQLGKGFTPEEKIRVLTGKENIDPLIARAIVAPNTLSPGQRAELRRMGIKPKARARRGILSRPPQSEGPSGETRPT